MEQQRQREAQDRHAVLQRLAAERDALVAQIEERRKWIGLNGHLNNPAVPTTTTTAPAPRSILDRFNPREERLPHGPSGDDLVLAQVLQQSKLDHDAGNFSAPQTFTRPPPAVVAPVRSAPTAPSRPGTLAPLVRPPIEDERATLEYALALSLRESGAPPPVLPAPFVSSPQDDDLARALELSRQTTQPTPVVAAAATVAAAAAPSTRLNGADSDADDELLRRAMAASLVDATITTVPNTNDDDEKPLTWFPTAPADQMLGSQRQTKTRARPTDDNGDRDIVVVDDEDWGQSWDHAPDPKRPKSGSVESNWHHDSWQPAPAAAQPAPPASVTSGSRMITDEELWHAPVLPVDEEEDRRFALELQRRLMAEQSTRNVQQMSDDHRIALELQQSFKAAAPAPKNSLAPAAALGNGNLRRALAQSAAESKSELAARENENLVRAIKASLMTCGPDEMQSILRQLSSAADDDDEEEEDYAGLSAQQLAEADGLAEALALSIQAAEDGSGLGSPQDQIITETIKVPGHLAPILIGRQYTKLHELEQATGCQITVPRKAMGEALVDTVFTVTGTCGQVAETLTIIRTTLARFSPPRPAPGVPRSSQPVAQRPAGNVHIFVDFSNIQHGAKTYEDGSYHSQTRLNIPELVRLIEEGRECASRELVGSTVRPAPGWEGASDAVWDQWRRFGYRTHVGWRNQGQKESFVDEALHSAISKRLLDERLQDTPQTMVLLTGDGNDEEAGTSNFPDLAAAAARLNWHVEIWSWRHSLSSKFREVKRRFPGRVEIKYLDQYREFITFSFK